MKKLFNILFALVLMSTMVLFHAVTIRAQETVPSQESDSLEQTASLQETTSPETVSIKIARTAICRDVVDREPVEVGESFDASVGKLYCFSKIIGAKTPIEVTHAWYFGDTEVARVNLPVRSTSWRTYSSKIIMTDAVGDWHVDLIGPEGEVLKTLAFKVIP